MVVAPRSGRAADIVGRLPPTSFFLTSAVFHYLGPSLAVLLFVHVGVLGVAWLRIAAAAVVFAVWRRPWRIFSSATRSQRTLFIGLGTVLAAMNSLFYLAVDRLPLSTVGAIESRHRHPRRRRRPHSPQHPCSGHSGRGDRPSHHGPVVGPTVGLHLRVCQLRRLHALRDPRPPDRQHRGRRNR